MERFAIKIDKNLKTHLYKICRLCGIDNPEKVKVLDDETIVSLEDGEPELWKKVLDCIGLLITKDDKMPQFMCTLCVDKINDFFEFREMCYATDGQTRKLLGIKDEPKLKVSTRSVDCKTEDIDIKQPVAFTQRTGRKRRNADMDICNAAAEIKIDQMDDVKPATTVAGTSASKKKRLRLDNPETETKQEPDLKPGPSVKSGLSGRIGPALKLGKAGALSKLGLTKKHLKIEPAAKKEVKPTKISKLTKKKPKDESPSPVEIIGEHSSSLQMQKKKKSLDLLKQRKLAKRVAVVKVEKLRKGSVDTKIKEETPVTAPTPPPAPPQPKVKLKDKCSICSEYFVNKTLLDNHIKVTHIPSIVRYHCVQCNETLKKNMEIKNHNLWHKLSKTPFQCGNCAESACSIYTYSKHIRDCGQVTYLDAHIPDWHCPECSGIFETTYLFNIHSCVSNKLVCPGCDRSYKWKEDYLKHIPECPSAIHRIPEYMSSNVQVKNEAEHPASPVPPIHTLAPITPLQATPSSRITPPLMDSNQCVVIPGNVALLEDATSSPSKNTGKKSKRITKKDLKRFDELLKSTMTTLVSIKQEPPQGGAFADEDQLKSSDVEAVSESPPGSPPESAPCSPLPADDDFQHNDDDDDESADEQSSSTQRVGTIKQEIIDEGYRDLYNNIEVNIKREVTLNHNRNTEASTTLKKKTEDAEAPITPKPVLKLKITKEHGTLNSVLLDSPKSEKKKKKKKRKEEKLKAAESREEANASRDVHVEASEPKNTSDVPVNVDQNEHIEEEPPMPLPEIVCIKQEIAELTDGETDNNQSILSTHTIPSIVAATSGSLQIACVSEGVHFNGADEDVHEEDLNESAEPLLDCETTTSVEQQEEIDIKPRLEDLIPMLRITSVSSGEDLIRSTVKPDAKRKRKSATTKAFTTTPQIVSVSCGSAAVAYQPELQQTSDDASEGEQSCEKVNNNENIFDFTQVTIKEEVIDTNYGEQEGQMPQADEAEDEDVENENEEENLENNSEEDQCSVTEKQAEENAYIANIDFTNLNIKQEKEYIDDGLDNAAPFEESDSSDTESESSSDTEDNDSESEREYRDLPMEDNDYESNAVDDALGLQIAAIHSEFAGSKSNEKTESNRGVPERSDDRRLLNSPTATIERGSDQVAANNPLNTDAVDGKLVRKISENLTNCKKYIQTSMDVAHPSDSKLEEILDQPSTSTARNLEQEAASVGSTNMLTRHGDMQPAEACTRTNLSQEFAIFPSCMSRGNPFELKSSTSTETEDFKASTSIDSKSFALPSETSTSAVAEVNREPLVNVSYISNVIATENHQLPTAPIMTPSSFQETNNKTNAANKVSSVATQDLFKCDRITGSLTNKSAFNRDGSTIFTTFQDFGDSSSSSQGSNDQLQAPPPPVPDVASPSATNQTVNNTDARRTANDMQPTRTNIALDVINKFIDQSSILNFSTLSSAIPDRNVSATIDSYVDDDDINMGEVEPIGQLADDSPTLLLREIDEFTKTDEETSAPPKADEPPETENLSDSCDRIALLPTVQRVNNSSLFGVPAAADEHTEQDRCQLMNTGAERQINFTQVEQHHMPPHSLSSHCMREHSAPQSFSVLPPSHRSEKPTEINLTNVLSSSVLQQTPVSYTHSGNTHEFNRETAANYPSYSTNVPRFTSLDRSIHLTELGSSTPLRSTELQVNFTIPTAGQLHSLNAPTNTVQPQHSSGFSLTTDTDLNLVAPVLSEEVQNLLNDNTIAANHFQLNESILRARCSTLPQSPAIAVSVSNFTDFENVNEIAENNNNANIERELQDELGNVLAAAIADRSPNDEAEDNNVMNENRANFDIT